MSAMPPSLQALTPLVAGAWLAQAIAVIAKLGVADLLSAGPRAPAEFASATGSEATAMYRCAAGFGRRRHLYLGSGFIA